MAKSKKSPKYRPLHSEIVDACINGDQKAQFELYQLYFKAMYNTALRIVKDPDDAEDIMQEAFLKAFLKLDTYRGEVSIGAWIKRIVVNKSLDFLRIKKEMLSLGEHDGYVEEDEDVPGPDTAPAPEEIQAAVQRLPEGYRVVLSLILFEGYDHDEVSSILNISNSTSRTQYHRARKKLIEELNRIKKTND